MGLEKTAALKERARSEAEERVALQAAEQQQRARFPRQEQPKQV